jgi:hypothetical protein
MKKFVVGFSVLTLVGCRNMESITLVASAHYGQPRVEVVFKPKSISPEVSLGHPLAFSNKKVDIFVQ